MTDDLGARLSNVRFQPVRLREAYAMGEVDQLLDELAAAVDRGDPLAPLIDAATLDKVRFVEGYAIGDVDAFLAEVRAVPVPPPTAPAEHAPAGRPDLVQQIEQARFTPVRLREGYDMGEVDYFLDSAQAMLARGESIAGLVGDARFTVVRLREGYDMAEVDAFLASLLERPASPPVVADPGVITENRSLFERLFRRR